MLEVTIEERACTRIQLELGVVSLKLNVQSNTGWPDRLYLVPGGKPFFIEFKQPGAEPEPRQRLIHAQLRYLGYEVEVHDTIEEAVQAVKRKLEAAIEAGWAHSEAKASAAKMDAAQLPEKIRKVHAGARSGSAVPRPRTR